METQTGHRSEASLPPSVHARRVCAGCPRWQVPPGRLAHRCCIDGAITIADHHCHLEARMFDSRRTRTAPSRFEVTALVRDGTGRDSSRGG